MNFFTRFLKSSIGAKMVVAVTGLALVAFVAQHLVANLMIFGGREGFNAYAYNLKNTWWLVWGGRVGLLTAFIIHVAFTIRLAAMNKAARPVAYAKKKPVRSTLASRTMVLSGLLVLSFVFYHLAHFTFGGVDPQYFALRDSLGRHDAYSMVILGFQQPLISISYAFFMVLVGLHLSHGVSSLFQSLGWNSAKYRPIVSKVGPVFATLIVVGFLTIPAAIVLGLVELPPGVSP